MDPVDLKNSRYSFLERSIGILVVDDEPAIAVLHCEHLRSYKLYHVACASSIKEAESMLLSSRRFHVCLLDLGIADFDHDEYYLIRKFSPKVSFLIVSARDSLEKGFKAGSCGAYGTIKKPVDFYSTNFIDLINNAFFRSLIIPDDLKKCKPVIKEAIESFISFKPTGIEKWADNISVDKRHLRKVWTECFGYPPKYVLWFHKIFYHAFSYYKALYCEKFRIKQDKTDFTAMARNDLANINKQFRRFFHTHREAIENILRHKVLCEDTKRT